MGLGSWQLSADWDPELYGELLKYRHVEIYQGETLIFVGPILDRQGDEDGINIGGPSMLWYLGESDKGPVIRDRRRVSGRNKYENPSFALGSGDFPGGGILRWNASADTKWVFAHEAAITSGNLDEDDILESEQQWPARPGDQFELSATLIRGSGTIIGHIRHRLILGGRFTNPDLLEPLNGDFEDGLTHWNIESPLPGGISVIDDPNNAGQKVLKFGPTPRLQVIKNPDFALGTSFWGSFVGGDWHTETVDGAEALVTPYNAGDPVHKQAVYDNDANTAGIQPVPAQLGERWVYEEELKGSPGTTGEATGTLAMITPQYPAGTTWTELETVREKREDWRHLFKDFTIGENVVGMQPYLNVWNHTAGTWYYRKVKLTRIEGNFQTLVGTAFKVTPGRTYQVAVLLRTDTAFQAGEFRVQASYADSNDEITHGERSPGLGTTLNQQMWWFHDFVPPSGSIRAVLTLWGLDIIGGAYLIERVMVRDKDSSTRVFDIISPETTTGYEMVDTITAPEGTETARAAIVAERMATGWVVPEVSIRRVDQPPSTAQDIVRQLLVDETSGRALSVLPGNIAGSDIILSDWDIENETNRKALDHLTRGGLWPGAKREYRVNPDRTLDVKENIGNDRTDVVLADRRDQELLILDGPEVEESAAEAVTDIIVLGEERETPTGKKYRVVGSAHRDLAGAVDYNGQPLTRTHIVEDSSADHVDLANAVASYELELLDHPSQSVRLGLSDHKAYFGRIVPGDFIYVYKPEAGFEDTSYQREVDGKTVFPKKTRVWEQTINMGGGYTAYVRRLDGSTLEIPVTWEDSTSVELEVGDRPEWDRIDPRVLRRAG